MKHGINTMPNDTLHAGSTPAPATYLNQRVWEFDELPNCRQNGFSKPPEPPKSRIRETFEALEHAKQMLRNEQYANNTD